MEMELRTCVDSKPELRKEGERSILTGYAAVFYDGTPDTEFRLFGNVFERVLPGAFDELLTRRETVVALFNHDDDKVLGSTAARTLDLTIDKRGLLYRIDVDQETTSGRDVLRYVDRGDVAGSSFAFLPRGRDGERWTLDEDEREIRELVDVMVRDVGPATFPAYAGSTAVAERSLSDWKKRAEEVGRRAPDRRARAERIRRRSRLLSLS